MGYVKEIGITLMFEIARNNSEPLPSSVCGRTYVVKAFTCGSKRYSKGSGKFRNRPYVCTKKVLWEMNSLHMLKLSFTPSNLQSC